VRLWSLHPRYLDAPGLVALWREGLLARAVLRGETRGYHHHPQLERFRAHASPRRAIDAYLHATCDEASARGYHFDRRKLGSRRAVDRIAVTRGQMAYEWSHLRRKLRRRAPARHRSLLALKTPACHPLFRRQAGAVASWERV
jgi:hypothetical protein